MNTVLLYLVIFKSPAAIKTYSILIANFAISDLLAAVSSFFVEPRIIPIHNSVIQINYGMCYKTGYIYSCYLGYIISLHLFLHSEFSLLYSFYFRLNILENQKTTHKPSRIILSLCIIYVPSLIFLILLSFGDISYQIDVFESFMKLFPNETGISVEMVTGNMDSKPVAIGMSLFVIAPIFIYTAILLIRNKIIKLLDKSTDHLRKETKSLHRRLLKILTYQAILPMFTVIAVFLFLIEKLLMFYHPLIEYSSTLCLEIIPAISPIVYFWYISPYRRAILKFFGIKKISGIGEENSTENSKAFVIIR
ncbi:unnamed protein product [Caenorhabditis angaria]|uniref:G-protein coupled receptors family 1 profile domain-containing protein n=1 Tax=Caenorhabditis angaria TaxID=860376 RepID=A0A9P1N661_9PELO|nr:unnamed protein product [Caenorhabditis angaria]